MKSLFKKIQKFQEDFIFKKTIKNSSIRRRKITNMQRKYICEQWNKNLVQFKKKYIKSLIFFQKNSVILEIGFGNGIFITQLAKKFPKKFFLGIEVYLPGIARCLQIIEEMKITNLKIIYFDAYSILQYMIPDNSIEEIFVFFPDPWNKNKHKKRRMLKKNFLEKIFKKLKYFGKFRMVSDSVSYIKEVKNILKKSSYFHKIQNKTRVVKYLNTKYFFKKSQNSKILELSYKKLY
ncbi:tRNA (guanosine(46)-N7)-methyltransferase TrmB [bacterium endosymbiont of Pedicinus badii]|uniref:tRNA (guanosine(46)-N7)-methyltransferase TrmB n=1 Tax=bacterium endosymbiont of Pedicinus badii TaxID=1719126 RepID=UPI0011816379|nr:tRNA (guanosine(46)-N7)-methyltransferase TrmB [bacterium endosymbiont of Pedicinus badii]